jgi:hypothetical protein
MQPRARHWSARVLWFARLNMSGVDSCYVLPGAESPCPRRRESEHRESTAGSIKAMDCHVRGNDELICGTLRSYRLIRYSREDGNLVP